MEKYAAAAGQLMLLAAGVACCGARRGAARHLHVAAAAATAGGSSARRRAAEDGGGGEVWLWRLNAPTVAAAPVVASAVLVLVYVAFKTFDEVFLAAMLVLCTACVAYALHPAASAALRFGSAVAAVTCARGRVIDDGHDVGSDDGEEDAAYRLPPPQRGARRLATLAATALSVAWAWNGHWVLNDVYVGTLALAAMSVVALPGLRVGTAFAAGGAGFALAWSRLAPRILGEDLLNAVLTHEATSVLADVVRASRWQLPAGWAPRTTFHLPSLMAVPVWRTMEVSSFFPDSPPYVVMVGWLNVGVANIVVGGMLLALARYMDTRLAHAPAPPARPAPPAPRLRDVVYAATVGTCRDAASSLVHDALTPSLFRTAFLGFLAGILASFIAGPEYAASQTGLVIVVPAIVVPLMLHAACAGTLQSLWDGVDAVS